MKNFHIVALVALFSSLSVKAEIFNISCSAPDIQTLNRFNGEVTLVAEKNEDGTYSVKSSEFSFVATKAGFVAEIKELAGNDMLTNYRYIESEFTAKPFYQLTMIKPTSESNEVASVNILIDYPGKLDSSIRLKNGMTYKSHCNLQ